MRVVILVSVGFMEAKFKKLKMEPVYIINCRKPGWYFRCTKDTAFFRNKQSEITHDNPTSMKLRKSHSPVAKIPQ